MFRSLISKLKSKVLIYFKSFSLVSSCINEFHKFFPSKFSFRFLFHSVFRSVPFCVLVTPLMCEVCKATHYNVHLMKVIQTSIIMESSNTSHTNAHHTCIQVIKMFIKRKSYGPWNVLLSHFCDRSPFAHLAISVRSSCVHRSQFCVQRSPFARYYRYQLVRSI